MPRCFYCKTEVGTGGVLQEDGRLLCVECDHNETMWPSSPAELVGDENLRAAPKQITDGNKRLSSNRILVAAGVGALFLFGLLFLGGLLVLAKLGYFAKQSRGSDTRSENSALPANAETRDEQVKVFLQGIGHQGIASQTVNMIKARAIGPELIEPLFRYISSQPNPGKRCGAYVALSAFAEAEERLFQQLSQEGAETKDRVLFLMKTELQTREGVNALAVMLSSEKDSRVIVALIECLASQKNAALEHLELMVRKSGTFLEKEGYNFYRFHTASAIAKLGESAIPKLIELLNERGYRTRRQAANVLGELGPKAKSAIPALVEKLKDDQVCIDAAYALGNIGTSALPAIKELLVVKDERQRIDALINRMPYKKNETQEERLKNVEIQWAAEKDQPQRLLAVCALRQMGPAAIPTLKALIEDFNPEIREAAKEALKSIDEDDKQYDILNKL